MHIKKCINYCITIIAISVSLYSCSKCHCEDTSFGSMTIMSYTHAADAFANVDVYAKGTDFRTVEHSVTNIPIDTLYEGHGYFTFNFDDGYDYKISIYPSGKVYKLKKMSHTHNTQSNLPGTGGCEECANGYSYTLNDTTRSNPEVSGHGGVLSIPAY